MRYQLRHVRVVTTNLPCRFSIEQGGRCCAVENSSRRGSDSSNRGDSVGSVRRNRVGGAAEFAHYSAQEAVECVDVLRQPEALESGWWAVVGEANGRVRAWRFAKVEPKSDAGPPRDTAAGAWRGLAGHTSIDSWRGSPDHTSIDTWRGPPREKWVSSLSANSYIAAVESLQRAITSGTLQQCNLTRVLSAPLKSTSSAGGACPTGAPNSAPDARPSAAALHARLRRKHFAPLAGYIDVPENLEAGIASTWLVSASPELFLRRDGMKITSAPIKGTAATADELLAKDELESSFIAGEVAAEFTRFCSPDSVQVAAPRVEDHPGLVQLVREVRGELRPQLRARPWGAIFENLFPPASVAGFPRLAAARAIEKLETAQRGPYCGIFGWVDGDKQRAELAVTIRSFWWQAGQLHFGTGAGITASSDPRREWEETELKASRLLRLASQQPVDHAKEIEL